MRVPRHSNFLHSVGRALVLLLVLIATLRMDAASAAQSTAVIGYAKETRNRAAVLLVGPVLTAEVAERLQARWADEAGFFRPAVPVRDVAEAETALAGWLAARSWQVAILNLTPGTAEPAGYARAVRSMVVQLQARDIVVVWAGAQAPNEPATSESAEAAVRSLLQAEGAVLANLGDARHDVATPARGVAPSGVDAVRLADALSPEVRQALYRRSTPWAEPAPGRTGDLTRLLADPQLFAAPMDLPEAKGTTATVYRAEAGGWQFNLHSFVAHHEGKFWAIWSSGRVNEDSSSQLVRYATSADGLTWDAPRVLMPDPDGESGPWRWMASGIYVDGDRLVALGSLNQGNLAGAGPWARARLVRFAWRDQVWREEKVVADNCVVYFPPLRHAGRDFFVWRDSRAHFFTGYAPAGTDQWKVTRMPGPLPDYRMSETSAYVDPEGIIHLIIRDQGYTRRLYHAVSRDAGETWTIPVKTNYPDAVSKNQSGRLSNGWYYLINNPKAAGANPRDPLAISFSQDGWTFSRPWALRKGAPPLRFKGGAKGSHSFQYAHAIEHGGKLWVIYSTNKEDIEITAYPIAGFELPP